MATPSITTRLNTSLDTKTGKDEPFHGQKYSELKKYLQKEDHFEDPFFKASLQSLGYDSQNKKTEDYPKLSWKRPKEICKDGVPHFIKKGMDLSDVKQQKLGDCWFVAAVACLTQHKELLSRVVPQDQSFDKDRYAGIFHFKFWHYGKWVDVVVDDRLPVLDGKLYFSSWLKKNDGKDFWMPLLEKACAKLNGSYAALIGGRMSESFACLTGGIVESIYPEIDGSRFIETIVTAMKTKSLLGAATKKCKKCENGLLGGHAYSIIDIKKFSHDDKEVQLLRLRNPWGHKEWKGRWSDNSKMWTELQKKQPKLEKQLNVQKDEGEFWLLPFLDGSSLLAENGTLATYGESQLIPKRMRHLAFILMELDDFIQNFRRVDICYINFDEFKKGAHTHVDGHWTRGTTAGGCKTEGNNKFWDNPQIFVSLWKPDEGPQKSRCTVSLMQKNGRKGKRLILYFYIFQVPKEVTKEELKKMTPTEKSKKLSKYLVSQTSSKPGDIAKYFDLDSGNYLLIPCTKSQGDEGDFFLRIITDTKHECLERNIAPRSDSEELTSHLYENNH